MPLDVQPLSRTRRWLMVVVMAALLAASLGFAQVLVQRRILATLRGRRDKLAGPCPVCGGRDRFAIHLGKQVFHMGEISKGQAVKLAMNLQIALIYEGFAEALTLATKLGVSIDKMLPLIQASMVRSGVFARDTQIMMFSTRSSSPSTRSR